LTLSPGNRIGPYEIESLAGAGAMGEVYRARDVRLHRNVAIKILSAALAGDQSRLGRLQREAQVLASLNHPNIAAIYGIEDAGTTRALVLEFVDGPTLADRVSRGAIPVDEALPIARQIASALEAAHEHGIIHRDLKPANIKLTTTNDVKVLDFGLAKVMEPVQTDDASVTKSAELTQVGMVLGTAAYMSPEQARGRAVDTRTDIWAFGCVLFEMLTGARAFAGNNGNDTIASVLRTDPDWTTLPHDTPPSVRRILHRCLEKDPRRRLRHIGDATFDLENTSEPNGVASSERPPTRTRISRGALVSATVVLIAAVLAVATWERSPATLGPDKPVVRFDVDLGPDVALRNVGSDANRVAISPDGTRLVYDATVKGRRALFMRRLDQTEPTVLAPGGAGSPFFSADGRWLGFFAENRLNRVSVDGGTPTPIATVRNFVGASWGEDGYIVAGQAFVGGLIRVPADGGAPTSLTTLAKGELVHAFPQVLSGGKAVLFTAYTNQTLDVSSASIRVVTVADGRQRTLVQSATSPRYLPSGHLVYVMQNKLFAVPFNADTLETSGSAIPVLEDLAVHSVTNTAYYDASQTGTFVYHRTSGANALPLMTIEWVNTTGRTTPLPLKPGVFGYPRLSPDSTR
jgi:serine/threonine-protein kinase